MPVIAVHATAVTVGQGMLEIAGLCMTAIADQLMMVQVGRQMPAMAVHVMLALAALAILAQDQMAEIVHMYANSRLVFITNGLTAIIIWL
jgi:hypothetical protein